MSRLTRDGTTEPVSRDKVLRREQGQENIHFPCSTDHEQDWQSYPVDPYACYMCVCGHTVTIFIDTGIETSYCSLLSCSRSGYFHYLGERNISRTYIYLLINRFMFTTVCRLKKTHARQNYADIIAVLFVWEPITQDLDDATRRKVWMR